MSAASTGIGVLRRGAAPKLGLILALIAAAGALASIDAFLESAQQTELHNQAQEAYREGERQLQQGDANGAVEALRRAHALERRNVRYERELVDALAVAGKTEQAEPLLNEVLDANRNDGAANLVAAHLRSKEGKIADADAYYHRTIYGTWPRDAREHRIAAREELIEFLIAHRRTNELLAELLPLEEEAGRDPVVQPRLGLWFLEAGSPARAADVFRNMLHEHRDEADAYAGLGEAELQMGDYRSARAALADAAARKPGDATARSRLQVAETLAAWDPTPRGLPSSEKYRRSIRLLEWTQQELEKCIQARPPADAQDDALLTQAETAMQREAPSQPANELSEATLALAQKIWQARVASCGATTSGDDEPLRLLMSKLAQ